MTAKVVPLHKVLHAIETLEQKVQASDDIDQDTG
jgi:hypothetical protein